MFRYGLLVWSARLQQAKLALNGLGRGCSRRVGIVLAALGAGLNALSPLAVLSRGTPGLSQEELRRHIAACCTQTVAGQTILARLPQGSIEAQVTPDTKTTETSNR